MIITIDTEKKTCEFSEPKAPDLVEVFNRYHGATEYNDTVMKMIKWYYGRNMEVAWCAIALSYVANEAGLLDKIGGKNCNVNKMRIACRDAAAHGYGRYFDKDHIPSQILKNDILFWLWDGQVMNDASSKHVGIAEYPTTEESIFCLGGNQKDKICTVSYKKNLLYAVYRIGG